MKIKVAVAGFRHFHIFDLYRRVIAMEDTKIVAACEADPTGREELVAQGSAGNHARRFRCHAGRGRL